MASVAAGGVAASLAPRVYLRVRQKRGRDGFVEGAPASQLVRVQWDAEAMGDLPPPLRSSLPARSHHVFRRLACPTPAMLKGARAAETTSAAPRGSTGSAAQRRVTACVAHITQARSCLVIECADAAEAPLDDADATLYVLDTRASEEAAMREAFGEFAITDDVAADATLLKREREDEAAEGVAELFLAPARKTPRRDAEAVPGCTPDEEAGVLGAAGVRVSNWGPLQVDTAGVTWALLQAYDETLCADAEGNSAAADLYCYPDHRKDDEYDSNAEDFSGNDYPDDADRGSSITADGSRYGDGASSTSSGRGRRRSRAGDAYGMFCEESYSERSLSSGWGSDDE